MRWPISKNSRPSRPTTFDPALPDKMRRYFQFQLDAALKAEPQREVIFPTVKHWARTRGLSTSTWRTWARAKRPGVAEANEFAEQVRQRIGELAEAKQLRLVFDTEMGK
jgi:hypothetical protein